MTEWIDLNAPESEATRQLARTLCESRIARARSAAIGAFARSELLARVHGAFSRWADRLCWLLTLSAGAVAGLVIGLTAGAAR